MQEERETRFDVNAGQVAAVVCFITDDLELAVMSVLWPANNLAKQTINKATGNNGSSNSLAR